MPRTTTGFYQRVIADVGTFSKEYSFGFVAFGITIVNDANATIEFSFDGEGVDGELLKFEGITFDKRNVDRVWVRAASGSRSVRIWAWDR